MTKDTTTMSESNVKSAGEYDGLTADEWGIAYASSDQWKEAEHALSCLGTEGLPHLMRGFLADDDRTPEAAFILSQHPEFVRKNRDRIAPALRFHLGGPLTRPVGLCLMAATLGGQEFRATLERLAKDDRPKVRQAAEIALEDFDDSERYTGPEEPISTVGPNGSEWRGYGMPFIEFEAYDLRGAELLSYLTDRLAAIRTAAERLHAEGWAVSGTAFGVTFMPPDSLSEGGTEEAIERLGLAEKLDQQPGRTLPEIESAAGELHDRVWHERRLVHRIEEPNWEDTSDPASFKGMIRAMRRVERTYGREALGVKNDFEWGMINGKLSALRWVLGDEWDMLDT
jgi:hypothetical protein